MMGWQKGVPGAAPIYQFASVLAQFLSTYTCVCNTRLLNIWRHVKGKHLLIAVLPYTLGPVMVCCVSSWRVEPRAVRLWFLES